MGRPRKPALRKPLAPKDSNIGHHSHQSDAAKQMMVDANHREADRRVAAIKAVCDAEVEGYLTQLRVALSMLSKEVRAMPLGEFVPRFCPNRELIRAPDSHIVELRPKPQNYTLSDYPSVADSFESHGNPIPSLQGQGLSTQPGFAFNASTVREVSSQIARQVAHDEVQSEEEEFLKFMESFRSSKFFHTNLKTPMGDQSMMGVTPKTMRLPKTGETLLSVNGSPLGVHGNDGMTSIPEERPRRARRRLRASAMLSNV